MSLNYLYVGYPGDINIGCGKTVSAVGDMLKAWSDNPDRTIFSNIKLSDVPYVQFYPDDIQDVLESPNALVLLDELHTIIHKNDRVSPKCQKHSIPGLCYKISEFLRQVRKNNIDTFTTCQVESDVYFQARQVMNVRIYCEIEHLEGRKWTKCLPMEYPEKKCPEYHYHRIKQLIRPSPTPWAYKYFLPEPFYGNYNSYEVVKGWIAEDNDAKN